MNTTTESANDPLADSPPLAAQLPWLSIALAYVFAIATWLTVAVLLFKQYVP